jgi:hypothetical protein
LCGFGHLVGDQKLTEHASHAPSRHRSAGKPRACGITQNVQHRGAMGPAAYDGYFWKREPIAIDRFFPVELKIALNEIGMLGLAPIQALPPTTIGRSSPHDYHGPQMCRNDSFTVGSTPWAEADPSS